MTGFGFSRVCLAALNIFLAEAGALLAKIGILAKVLLKAKTGKIHGSTLPAGSTLRTMDIIVVFSTRFGPVLGGLYLIGFAARSQYRAIQKRNREIEKCKKKYPGANHTLAFLQF